MKKMVAFGIFLFAIGCLASYKSCIQDLEKKKLQCDKERVEEIFEVKWEELQLRQNTEKRTMEARHTAEKVYLRKQKEEGTLLND